MTKKIRLRFLKMWFLMSDFFAVVSSGVKGQLQRFYKLISYERASKMLKNDMCITEIGQAVLEL